MNPPVIAAAIDLGASSGRVITGRLAAAQLDLREVHRFPNTPVSVAGTLHWDILKLYDEVLTGLRAATQAAALDSIGIDSWAVDFGLLDSTGAMLGNPVHYRDRRTDGVAAGLASRLDPVELYAATGIAPLTFNTIFQLAALTGTPQLSAAATLLMIPDLLAYWLTGEAGGELTNASTTGLLDAGTRTWSRPLIDLAGLPPAIFPPLRRPGDLIGQPRPEVARAAALPAAAAIIAVASHDTASAVAAVPASGANFAYISCGTWSLVGLELTQPVLTAASLAAGFSNEAGIDGTTRYLRNVMGLWLLQESVRGWSRAGLAAGPDELVARAAQAPALRAVIDPDDPVFLPPGDMPARIAAACRALGQPVPDGPVEFTRCIIDSLALAHQRAIRDAQELTGRQVDAVSIVGGGARNALLCQLTADACQLPVIAGPAEATAIGNVLVQARALGAAPDDLPGLRALVRGTQPLTRYTPRGRAAAWRAAARRLPGAGSRGKRERTGETVRRRPRLDGELPPGE